MHKPSSITPDIPLSPFDGEAPEMFFGLPVAMARAMALRGEISRGEAVELIKLGSRRYAKRQMTWFRRTENALRIDWDENPDFEAARRLSTAFLHDSGIL